mgnify:CR=1 FL=1
MLSLFSIFVLFTLVFSYTGEGEGDVPKDITVVHVRKGVKGIKDERFKVCEQLKYIKHRINEDLSNFELFYAREILVQDQK